MDSHVDKYLDEAAFIMGALNRPAIGRLVGELLMLRKRKGRLFMAGMGGSAANASHAVNDFRRLCEIDAVCLTDNVALLTAGANDDGWDHAIWSVIESYELDPSDALFILSVGGGTEAVSRPLSMAVENCLARGLSVLGIVGRDGGITAKHAKCCVLIPTVNPERVTPHTEAFQSIILHCLVSHPDLQTRRTKW